jgi:phenylacetic acid degradation operon negative regulatory protein
VNLSSPSFDQVAPLLAKFTARRPIRTGSLIVTVFGDAILPRGGGVLLADLIVLLEAFSLNESQVRTALSRLLADGWLEAERRGRRSLYRLSEIGRHRFAEASRRIYSGPPQDWKGEWHVAILPPSKAAREELRKDLGWIGFGTLAPGILLHPAPDPRSLASIVRDRAERDRPLVICGTTELPVSPKRLRDLVARCWDLAALTAAYRRFLDDFSALAEGLRRGASLPPLPALLARLMLIHDYRRIVLRDPMLPPGLLPRDWIGRAAYETARSLYRGLAPPAERWIDEHLRGATGPLPQPDAAFGNRFA